jgi:uncharacterized membrane protein
MAEDYTGSETINLTKGRLESLSDGIFAFSMTLLVIGLNIPDKVILVQSTEYAAHLLVSLHYDFLHYIIAFLILGAFWLSHHSQLHSVRNIDIPFVWINLITLLFVALLPFSTSFSGDFPEIPLGAMVFEANLFAVGMGMFCQWKYATYGHRLTDPALKPAYIRKVSIHNLFVPAVSIVCILVALAGNTSSMMIYITLPLVHVVGKRLDIRLHGAGR